MGKPEKSNLELHAEIELLKSEISEIRLQLTKEKKDRSKVEFLLGERLKELKCSNSISKIFSAADKNVNRVLNKILLTIPPAMQYPEIAEAAISVDEKVYETSGFTMNGYLLEQIIFIDGKPAGKVSVCYPEEKYNGGNNAFLKEEEDLLFTISTRIAGYLTQIKDERIALENEKLYQSVLDSSPDVISITDLAGNILFSSSRATKMFGFPDDYDYKGFNILQFIYPNDHQKAMDNIGHMLHDNFTGAAEYTAIKQNGELFTIEVNGEFLRDYKGNPEKMIFVTRDVTERKIIEKRLTESEEKYRSLIESSDAAIVLVNLDGTIRFMNSIAAGFHGMTPDEMAGKQIADVLPETDVKKMLTDIDRIKRENKGFVNEVEISINDKKIHLRVSIQPVRDEHGNIVSVLMYSTNITESVIAREKLRKSEERFRNIVESINDVIFEISKEGIIQYASPSLTKISGFTPEEIIGKPLFAYVYPADLDLLINNLNGFKEGISTETEYRLLDKDNLMHWVRTVATPVFSDGVLVGISGTMTDVTEKKRAVDELRILKDATDSANYGIAINKTDGEIIYMNNTWAAMHGYTVNELLGKNLAVGHTVKQFERVKEEIGKLFVTGKMENQEIWHVKKDGTEFPTLMNAVVVYDKTGKPQYISATAIDISELINARIKLEKSELRYKTIFENIQDAYYETTPDGTILEISPSIDSVSYGQYKREDLLGQSILKIYSNPQDRNLLLEKLFREHKVVDYEIEFINRDGKTVPGSVTSTILFDENGVPYKIIGSMRNISERKEAIEKLKFSEERYRSMFRNNKSIILIIDPETREIKDANQAAVDFYGYTSEKLCSLKITDINIQAPEIVDQKMHLAKEEKAQMFNFRHKLANGELRDVEVFSGPIQEKNTKYLYSIIHDVTDRKKAEEALVTSENNLNIAQQIAHMGSWEFNVVTGEVKWSKNYYNLVGVDQGNKPLSLSEIKERIHPEDRKLFELKIDEIIKNRTVGTIYFRLFMPDNSMKWIQASMVPVFKNNELVEIDGISIDITEKKNNEIQIDKQRDQLEAIVKAIPDIMFIIDENGVYLEYYANEYQKLLVPRDAIVGKTINETMNNDDATLHLLKVKECFKTMSVVEYEYSMNINGNIEYFEARIVPMPGKNVLCFIREITGRKQNEKEIRKLLQTIQQSPVIKVITSIGGIIEYVNPAFEKVTGYTLEEIKGKNTNILQSGLTDKQVYRKLWETILKGEIWKGEWINRKKNGELYWEEVSISPIFDDNGQIMNFLAIKQDITERKETEKQLIDLNQNLEEKVKERTLELSAKTVELENFFNVSLDLLCIADLNGYFIKVNKAWSDILGYSLNELENHRFLDFVHTDDLPATYEVMGNLGNNEKVLKFINRYRTSTGEYRFIEWHSVPVGKTIYAAARDVTEAKLVTDFQAELLKLSSKLAGIPFAEIIPSLKMALEKIGILLNADRAYIFEFNADTTEMSNTFEWCKPGISSALESLQNLPTSIFPVWIEQIKNQQEVFIHDMNLLPDDWVTEREIIQSQGIKSMCIIPMLNENKVIGFAGLDYVENMKSLRDSEINILKLWSTMLAGLINNYRVEIILEQTRHNLQEFFDTIDDFLWVFDSEGRIIHINNSVKRRLGYNDEEILNKTVIKVHPESYLEEVEKLVKGIIDGEVETCNIPLLTKTGESIPVETHIKHGFWNGQPVIFGVSKDITQLQLSEQKFASAFHSSSAVMVITRYEDGRFVEFNNAFTKILGYTKESIVGKTIASLNIFRENKTEDIIKKALKAGEKVRDLEVIAYSENGDSHIFLLSAEEIIVESELCILSVAIDITDRKKAEDMLQWNKTLLEMMSNSSPLGFLVVDNRTDDILYFNKRFCQIWGIEQLEEPMKKGELKNNDIIPYCLPVLVDVDSFAASCKPLQDEENRAVISDEIRFANNRTIHRYSTQIRGTDDKYYGRFYIFEDVTEEKMAQKELIDARTEAEKANRAKSDFLSRMSHELRTPMNSILGFAQLLQMHQMNEKQARGVNHILQSGKYLLNMINEILELSRIESGKLSLSIEKVHLRPVIDEINELINKQLEDKKLTIEISGINNSLYLKADKQKLKQILLNLVVNAIKYNRENGHIKVMADVIENDEGIKYVRITVSDTGIGIAKSNLSRVFSPFERLGADKMNIEGTGLGLAVSKNLTEAMLGRIGLNSIENEGSEFWVEFPYAENPKNEQGKYNVITVSDNVNVIDPEINGTILYIEDNLSNIELIEEILADNRPNVRLFSDRDGLAYLKAAFNIKPDLILLDLNLPKIQGDEILEGLLQNPKTRNIPVVMVSADAMPSKIKQLLLSGARNYLTKPVNAYQLLKIVDTYLKK